MDYSNEKWLEFCTTDRQVEYVKALAEHEGHVRNAARALGVNPGTISAAFKKIRGRASRNGGYQPGIGMDLDLVDGQRLGKVTLQVGANGEVQRAWPRIEPDHQRQFQMMQEAVQSLKEDLPKYSPRIPPAKTHAHLCNQYTITDYHLGMLAWHEETGADWDLDIAENMLIDFFMTAIATSPPAEQAIFAQIGDFLHWDGMEAVTPTHRHTLDADTRYQKLVRVAIRVIRRVIDMLLSHHGKVHVIMATGNHDLSGAVWLRELLASCYEDEPRLTVDTNPDVYYGYQWGSQGLFYHHGHKRKPSNIDRVFAAKFKDIMFTSKHVEAHMGHLHNDITTETPLMMVYQHRTIAAPDSHAALGGWISGRDAKVITYHKEFGRVATNVINSDMLRRHSEEH